MFLFPTQAAVIVGVLGGRLGLSGRGPDEVMENVELITTVT